MCIANWRNGNMPTLFANWQYDLVDNWRILRNISRSIRIMKQWHSELFNIKLTISIQCRRITYYYYCQFINRLESSEVDDSVADPDFDTLQLQETVRLMQGNQAVKLKRLMMKYVVEKWNEGPKTGKCKTSKKLRNTGKEHKRSNWLRKPAKGFVASGHKCRFKC